MIILTPHSPKHAIKAFIKQKPLRADIDAFKLNLKELINKINIIENQPKDESEEHLKNNIRDFLRDTFYKDSHAINTKDKKDLVIHLGKTTDTPAGVIIEAKRPNNTNEMITLDNANKKALHELILYYFDERQNNNELKQLIITNVYEWYIFDSNDFDKHIYRNTQLKKLYQTKFNDKKDNPFFYEECAKILANTDDTLNCVFLNLKNYQANLTNTTPETDFELTPLFKLFSPQYLLKIANANDTNTLNEPFYRELLHIMGLEEVKQGSKNIIQRKSQHRNHASLLEQTIDMVETEDLWRHVKNQNDFGETKDEKIFNISLELCITWINRILFLKLLEGQLIAYHNGSKDFTFLNSETITDFNELFNLFHKVLAVNVPDRTEQLQQKYNRVPYLNSSLFDISELEDQTLKVRSLDSKAELELISTTVLKDLKKKQAKLPTLQYIFSFLNSYNFASDDSGEIQEENKTIINASVLGTVFEKINGYEDGSVFTPAFITMYMCRQSIRLAVLQKFNETKGWDLKDFNELENKIEDIVEANKIMNSLKICDPAVGSGHFLVSALNELIAIKSELKILIDINGKRIKDYDISVVDDELLVADDDYITYKYKAQNSKRPDKSQIQLIQETLFHEKQTIIENCLFGVDINPKSVLICRLRLWIELLKNAYYKAPEYTQLETLPNIDINIKVGNSLISRFGLEADLTKALKSIKYDTKAYRGFVHDYKNEKSRDVKLGLQQIINDIKTGFKTEINKNSKEYRKLQELQYEFNLLVAPDIFNDNAMGEPQAQYSSKENANKAKDRITKLQAEINKRTQEFDDIINNKIYLNAFEWRFEFPEVLNDNGDFEGFDLIIGNPPYISAVEMQRSASLKLYYKNRFSEINGSYDIYILFLQLGLELTKRNGNYSWIIPNKLLIADYAKKTLNILLDNGLEYSIDASVFNVFKGIGVYPIVIGGQKNKNQQFKKLFVNSETEFSLGDFKTINEISSDFVIKDFNLKIMSGTTGFEAKKIQEFVNENKKGIKFTVSGNIDKYEYNNINVRYMNSKYSNCYIKHDKTIANSKWEFWKNPKIVIAGMTKVIEAVYVEEPLALGVGCYAIYDFANINPKAIVGILNSKYLSYYLNIKFKDKHLAGGYLAINKSTIEALPFVEINKTEQKKIATLVDKIMALKAEGKDTLKLEQQIDVLVYELYNITPEEQLLIEAK